MFVNLLINIAPLFIVSFLNQYFLFAHSQSIPYLVEAFDINQSIYTNQPSIQSVSLISTEISEIPENCTRALQIFTENVVNFTRCTLLNARPIRVCVNCNQINSATIEAYNQLQKESSCYELFFESDQVGIIQLVYSQGRNVWSTNDCENCYPNPTEDFFNTSREFENCMKLFNDSTIGGLNDSCNVCEVLFLKMNTIYKGFVEEMVKKQNGGICMDVVDKMNITRHLWNSHHCIRFDSNIGYPNIVTVFLVGLIPLLFYLLSKNVSIIEDVKLVRPKRKSYSSLQDLVPSK